jgi:cytochrome d ubiquinol oxidase subunit II
MSYVSLFIPFVLAYIYIVWKAMDKKKLNTEDLNKEDNLY